MAVAFSHFGSRPELDNMSMTIIEGSKAPYNNTVFIDFDKERMVMV